MKKIWVSIAILVVIFLGSIFYVSFLNQFSTVMEQYTQTAYDNLENPSYFNESINSFLNHFDKHKMLLCSFIDHRKLNEIEDSAKACLELYKNGEISDLKLELKMLAEMINHIKDLEVFDLKNIL